MPPMKGSQWADELPKKFPLLAKIDRPEDLKAFSVKELVLLSEELRNVILDVVSRNGGHLASPLGAVDLTIALHSVFDIEQDSIIWDVGHQSHAHKILSDRKNQIYSLRRKGGLGGYPSRAESPYDPFGTGHSSTSVSAALGMSVARALTGRPGKAIAVIGDGALTGGMAYEALSHAGHLKKDILVILNDNNMSISSNVGALSSMLSKLITGGLYNRAKGDLKTFMEHTVGRHLTDAARKIESSVKSFVIPPGVFFQELGFRYFGPVDGNDIHTLVDCFRNIKDMSGPILFHCVTQKGKGYPYAEENPLKYHGVIPMDLDTGQFQAPIRTAEQKQAEAEATSFTVGFASALIEAAKEDERIVAITASMATGTGLDKFEEHFPDRFFDVGICEQHAVTFAAGLATQGMKPVAAIYSTFLQRGYDQYIHDVCLQNLPVVFAIDRAGLVGEDSPTQQGAFDLSFLRAIPNVVVTVPRDNHDLRLMLHWALKQDGPVALRYARSKAPPIGDPESRDVTRGEILREGTDCCFLAVGPIVGTCLQVAEALAEQGLSIGVADARFVKPLDTKLIDAIASVPIITVEENTLEGGFGSAVLEYLEATDKLADTRIRRIGMPDRFLEHATRAEQLATLGLDYAGLCKTVLEVLGRPATQPVE